MVEHSIEALEAMDLLRPALGGLVFISIMSLVPEPARQRFNAILVAGAGAAYLNGGLGGWELVFAAVSTVPAYLGLREYRFIAAAWLMHTAWDVVHHLYASPIWPWMPMSSAGCAVFDAVIGIWFWFRAPSVHDWLRGKRDAHA